MMINIVMIVVIKIIIILPLALSLVALLESNFPGKSPGNPYGLWNYTP